MTEIECSEMFLRIQQYFLKLQANNFGIIWAQGTKKTYFNTGEEDQSHPGFISLTQALR